MRCRTESESVTKSEIESETDSEFGFFLFCRGNMSVFSPNSNFIANRDGKNVEELLQKTCISIFVRSLNMKCVGHPRVSFIPRNNFVWLKGW